MKKSHIGMERKTFDEKTAKFETNRLVHEAEKQQKRNDKQLHVSLPPGPPDHTATR